jgi:hypothetical protein
MLASFGRRYIDNNWNKRVFPELDYQQELLRKKLKKSQQKARYGIARSVDLDSPRLVSHAIYSFIRRCALCVVDWTDWRPNVFFELGVRLAASNGRTVCFIEKEHFDACEMIKRDPKDLARAAREAERLGLGELGDQSALAATVNRLRAIAAQHTNLVELFDCRKYELGRSDDQLFAQVIGNQTPLSPECHAMVEGRAVIANSLDVSSEPVAVPLHRELLQSATRFASDDTEAISAVLFPLNERLKQVAAEAVKRRMWAAWRYLTESYPPDAIARDDVLRSEFKVMAEELSKHDDIVVDPSFLNQYQIVEQAIDILDKRRN